MIENKKTLKQKSPKLQRAYNHKVKYIRPIKLWQDKSSEQDLRVEIIPLIDVIFCILTFFILAAVGVSRQQAISLDLPKASTGKPQMREMMIVSLDSLGTVYLNKQPYTRKQIKEAIIQYHATNPDGMIVLNAAKNASYNNVIQILDTMRQFGGNRVSLATTPASHDDSIQSGSQSITPNYSNIPQNNPPDIYSSGQNQQTPPRLP
jgi:biopolymer transport protein ExbD